MILPRSLFSRLLKALNELRSFFAKLKGARGEKWVAWHLKRLKAPDYLIINDLLLCSGANSTQIDHVVVSAFGLFVIETKYYKGWIYGGAESEYWTQNIYGHKYQLRNPVIQNQGHIRAIRRLLKLREDIPIYNIVAFSWQGTLYVNRTLPVMYWRQVVPYIRQFDERKLSETEVSDIYKEFQSSSQSDSEARRRHIQNVRQNQYRRDITVSNGRCPRCGGKLVPRKGLYGSFYGCANYPRCRYILPE